MRGIIHAPAPVLAVPPPILPMITAPRVEDIELQKTFDRYASMVNVQAATWNATVHEEVPVPGFTIKPTLSTQAQEGGASDDDVMDMDVDEEGGIAVVKKSQDKENMDVASGRKRGMSTGGLGFGMSVPMKDQANTIYARESAAGKENGREKKERRSKREFLIS